MLINEIHPYIRFAAIQDFRHNLFEYRIPKINYDHRIYFCVEGKAEITINNEKYEIKKNDFLFFRSGSVYKISIKDENEFKCITCNFDFYNLTQSFPSPIIPSDVTTINKNKIREQSDYFEDCEILNNTLYIENFLIAKNFMENLMNEYNSLGNRSQFILRLELLKLFSHVFKHILESSNSNNQIIEQIIEYIETNYKQELSNEIIAKVFNFHPNYISQIVKKEKGVSLHKYVIKLRLALATKLLLQTKKPISLICEEVNIPDSKYFTRLYKKYYGISPSELRKLQ